MQSFLSKEFIIYKLHPSQHCHLHLPMNEMNPHSENWPPAQAATRRYLAKNLLLNCLEFHAGCLNLASSPKMSFRGSLSVLALD